MARPALVIADLDGTLYFATPVRAAMAGRLVAYYGLRPWRWRELGLLRAFRLARDARPDAADDDLVADLAPQWKLEVGRAGAVLERWLLTEPLATVAAHADRDLIALLAQARAAGVPVAVLSDYPTEAKLAALGVEVDAQICAAAEPINARKPSPFGVQAVLDRFGVSPEAALMVGDRDSRDGASARAAGVEAVILPPGRRSRRPVLDELRGRVVG
jgi:FMN phosphatase YigB (HAD superfamily)